MVDIERSAERLRWGQRRPSHITRTGEAGPRLERSDVGVFGADGPAIEFAAVERILFKKSSVRKYTLRRGIGFVVHQHPRSSTVNVNRKMFSLNWSTGESTDNVLRAKLGIAFRASGRLS